MKVPGTKDSLSYAGMSKVSMVRLEIAGFWWIINRPDADTAVAFARKAIAEFQFKVSDLGWLLVSDTLHFAPVPVMIYWIPSMVSSRGLAAMKGFPSKWT